ncbi:lantibiotic dehydratase [Streptomyces sp. URMC 129]|uniref:lantibiotic dehydratase n=1 Tax=Streptomyces sp. URMC 129 TaxID=3423407 RepID=UPI003F1E4631
MTAPIGTETAEAKAARSWIIAKDVLIKTTGFPFECLEPLRAQDITESARALLEVCRDDRFLEAVMLSSPDAFEQLDRWLAKNPDPARFRSDDRRKALLAAMYLQRFCAKNESTSFFGPVFWARLTDDSAVVLEQGEEGAAARRAVFWSHWAAELVADRMAADPDVMPFLAPVRPPNLVEREGLLRGVHFVDHPIQVSDMPPPAAGSPQSLLFKLVDGNRTVQECADTLGITVAEATELLRDLEAHGLVRFGLDIPVGVLEPMDHVRAFVATLPGEARMRWTRRCDELDGLRERFRRAEGLRERRAALDATRTRFEEITGAASARGAGGHYTDRAIVLEDCLHPWKRFDIGGPVRDYLEDELQIALNLLFELPLARRRARAAEVDRWFLDLFGRDRSVPLDEVLLAWSRDGHAFGAQLRALDGRILESGPCAISDVLHQNSDRRSVNLDLAWGRERAGAVTFDTWCVAGADILLGAADQDALNRGDFLSVIGEVHGLHDQLLQGLWTDLHPNADALTSEIADIISGLSDTTICDPVMWHWRKTIARAPALPEVEFAGRSPRPPGQFARARDLTVQHTGDRLHLHAEPLGRISLTRPPLRSWGDEVETLFTIFTGARSLGPDDGLRRVPEHVNHLPRLTVGRTVVHRETWWLPPPPRARWRAMTAENQRLGRWAQQEFGLPDEVYVKFAAEPKPVFVDFRIPVLVELFTRFWQRATTPAKVVEMLPDSKNLWVRDGSGRHTCELRIGCYQSEK